MQGHIYLHAQCPCGFERKLSPGSALGVGGYTIAYNADESDLLTEDETIKLQGLRTSFTKQTQGCVDRRQ
jgi:hypothetical protein